MGSTNENSNPHRNTTVNFKFFWCCMCYILANLSKKKHRESQPQKNHPRSGKHNATKKSLDDIKASLAHRNGLPPWSKVTLLSLALRHPRQLCIPLQLQWQSPPETLQLGDAANPLFTPKSILTLYCVPKKK